MMSSIVDDTLSEVAVVFTGALPSGMTRKEATKLVMSHGGIVEDRVTEFTTYLVAADPNKATSQKMQKAKDDGVKIISERELWDMTESGKTI